MNYINNVSNQAYNNNGKTMNSINTQTTRQYHTLAPNSLKFRRKTYKGVRGMFDDKTNTVFFKHEGRKQRGAFMKDQVSIIVKYDSGSDTYTITAKHFDGLTLDSTEIFSYDGMMWDQFADIQNYLTHNA